MKRKAPYVFEWKVCHEDFRTTKKHKETCNQCVEIGKGTTTIRRNNYAKKLGMWQEYNQEKI